MQIFIYCKVTRHVSGVTAPIIRSIKNCNRSLRYRSYYLYRYSPPTWSYRDAVPIRPRRLRVQFLVLLMMGAVTPETCRVTLQWINICILLHLLDFYSHWITMHGTMSLKKKVTNFVFVLPLLHPNVTQATFRTRLPAQRKQSLVLLQCKSAHLWRQPHNNKFSTTHRPAKDIINRSVKLIAHLRPVYGLLNETPL